MTNAFIVKPLVPTAISASTGGTAAGTAAAYLVNDFIGTLWRSTATSGNTAIDVDFSAAVGVDFAALLSSNGACATQQIAGATSQANLGSAGYIGAAAPFAAGATVPISGRINSFADLGSVQNYRWWRFQQNTLSAAFEAGRLVLGQKFQPARNFTFGASFGARDLGGMDWSRQAVPLETPGKIMRTVGLSWSAVSKVEAEERLQALLETIGNRGFATVVSDGDVNANRQSRMFHGVLEGSLDRLWRTADAFEWRCNLRSVI